MLKNLDFISENELVQWINIHLDSDEMSLSSGYQGKTLLYSEKGRKLVIKIALGNIFTRFINLQLLRHEYKIYQILQGMTAIPECYGMANNQFLVLEYIEGQTIRNSQPAENSIFFTELFEAIQEMHHRDVAHFDLKRLENLMVTYDNKPKLIDFGVSIHRKGGLHWLNQYLFNLAKQFDWNAWIRHKYNKQYHLISEEDRIYHQKTNIEIYSAKIKRFYRAKLKTFFN